MQACKSILITGGTGSFGQAFTERLLKDGEYDRICIYSRGEHAQAAMQEKFGDNRCRYFIGDVRDRLRLSRALAGVDVVVHAAALKRIEVGHYNPNEMVKTNILGAMNVIEAAQDAGVKKVIALSTDKAYQPISPYGQSKALAEAMFLAANGTVGAGGPRFTVTRYGNVWNSAGSVVPIWKHILRSGSRSVLVTDPDCTRFFMLMREAVDFVLAAIRDMKPEIKIPDLPAYRLGDLAEAMGAEQNVIGLPVWEKKHESMCEGRSSEHARRISIDELKEHLKCDPIPITQFGNLKIGSVATPAPPMLSPATGAPRQSKWFASICEWAGLRFPNIRITG